MEESYPLNQKEVVINGTEVTLRELPVAYVIGIEKGQLEDNIVKTCVAGSNASPEIIASLGKRQIESMHDDIMSLSYGDDWKDKAEKSDPSKKK